jgi:hypothetical protein
MSPFATTWSKTTQSISMVGVDSSSMAKKPKEVDLGSMVGGPTKELAKAKIFVFKILRRL